MRHRLLRAYVLLGVLACAWCAGCSKGGLEEGPVVIISGKLTDGGKPLVANADTTIEVGLFPYVEKGEEIPLNKVYRGARVDDKGEFKLTGNIGNGVAVGKYRVTVYQWEKLKPGEKITKEFGKGGKRDALKKKFDEKTSPIVREITRNDKTLEIDISKPEG